MDDQIVDDRALDCWVAINLFGFRWILAKVGPYQDAALAILAPPEEQQWLLAHGSYIDDPEKHRRFGDWGKFIPRYSLDLYAAWPIAEAIRVWLPQPSLMIEGTNFAGPAWIAAAADQEVSAETLPMALCMLAKELGEAHPDFLVLAQKRARGSK